MKNRQAKGNTKAKASDQLDLFARSSPTAVVPPFVKPVDIRSVSSAPSLVVTQPNPTADPLIGYVLGSRGRGRPELVPSGASRETQDQRRLLDVREAAKRLGLSKSTLDKMRCSGRGPRFIRASDRAVRYDPADLQAFAEERRRRSTSELAGMSAD